jgi:hypothetical protein
MLAKKKLYQDATPQCYPKELAEHIVLELNQMMDVEQRLKDLAKARLEADGVHQGTIDNIENDERDIRRLCSHHSTTYHPDDPSRSNDSFTKCDICGKVLQNGG